LESSKVEMMVAYLVWMLADSMAGQMVDLKAASMAAWMVEKMAEKKVE
jgi:hypothetical protein